MDVNALSRPSPGPLLMQHDGSWLHVPLDQARSSPLGDDPSFNASTILGRRQEHQIQAVAVTFSSISILSILCALYWFILMRRNFRRDLILLLIVGDFWKSLWFFVSAAVSLARSDKIHTRDPFCQASGYNLQVSAESCDLAIFLMSLHMSLQIFPPTQSILGHDGLYRIRYWVFAGWFIIPNFIVSLAFINRGPAFISQGGFCTLPIRPFWYRLALSWIPRYLFWVFVMGVAIRIYRHVGYEFKVFGMEEDHGSSSGIGLSRSELNSRPHTGHFAAAMHWPHANHSDGGDVEKQEPRDEELAPDEHVAMPALNLSPLSQVPRKISAGQDTRLISKSNPGSRRGSKHEVEAEAAALDTQNSAPLPATTTMQGQGSSSSTETSMKSASPLSPITEHRSASVTGGGPTLMQEDNVATRAIMKRRNAIQRQLRLLFIYPVVYLIMWVMPLVGHALNYSDYYAQHPIFAISLLALLSHCTMGFVDVCIFCWREKPWAHIPGADGTFWGSFKFWKFRRSWKQHRKSIAVHPNKSARRQTGAVDKIDSSSKAGGILQSITKRWSMKSKKQQQGSKFSQEEQGGDAQQIPLTTSPPPPPPRASLLPPQAKRIQHLRVNSGRSDRRILAAERAHERLALERAEFAERQQHKSWQGSEPSDRQQSPPPPREWWDRHMSIGDLDDHGLQ